MNADELVLYESPNQNRFKRAAVKQLVCELKFPTLLELVTSRPPTSVVRALRKDYPVLDASKEVTVNLGLGTAENQQSHIFRNSRTGWVATLKHSSVSVERSNGYEGYAELRKRVLQLIGAVRETIESETWTRIGLRYINVIETSEDPADGWINPSLTAPLSAKAFERVADYGGKIVLTADDGGCLLQHKLQSVELDEAGKVTNSKYVIDLDVYREDISVSDTASVIDRMHKQAFNLFDWTLGEKTREMLAQP